MRLKQETENHPELQDFDDWSSTPADGRSTAAVSSVGTPIASGSAAPKLKLTFNGNRDVYMNGMDSGMQSEDE